MSSRATGTHRKPPRPWVTVATTATVIPTTASAVITGGTERPRDANGRVWLDVLTTVATPERHKSPHLVVYERTEVTNYLRKPAR